MFGNSTQLLYVENVLFPATCKLVPDWVVFGDHIDLHFPIEEALNSVLPRLVESETINALQDIHACGRLADLESRAVREMAQQPACPAPNSSRGVVPGRASNREPNVYALLNSPFAKSISPLPVLTPPSQRACAVCVGMTTPF